MIKANNDDNPSQSFSETYAPSVVEMNLAIDKYTKQVEEETDIDKLVTLNGNLKWLCNHFKEIYLDLYMLTLHTEGRAKMLEKSPADNDRPLKEK